MIKIKGHFLFAFLGLFLVGGIYGVLFLNGGLTGIVLLELTSTYVDSENLKGDLKIFLKQGELIPESSKIIFENGNQTQEYNLRDVIPDETISGDFYLSQSDILGTGEGFGMIGEKFSYPKLYFKLKIFSDSSDEDSSDSGEEVIEENTEPSESSNVTEEEKSEPGNETGEIEETETILPENVEVVEKVIEETSEEEPGIVEEIIEGITTITGGVILSFEEEISGEFFSDGKFIYDLNLGQKAELVPGSLRTDSKNLSDGEINLVVEGNKVTVTSDYVEVEEGFGEEYTGDEVKILMINFSSFNFKPEKGDLKITITYEGEEIVSVDTVLEEGTTKRTGGGFLENLDFLNNSNEEGVEEYITLLTENENQRLSNKFGNQSVEITKAEKTSQGYLLRFELEKYWVEHHYSLEMSEERLELNIEEDKIRFLKDLANKILEDKERTESEILIELIG
jgi:hypothetical protein